MVDSEYLDILKKSYKKLKSSVYFDKTQLLIRDKIVSWETENDVDQVLSDIADALYSDNYQNLFDTILESISFSSFPKEFYDRNKVHSADLSDTKKDSLNSSEYTNQEEQNSNNESTSNTSGKDENQAVFITNIEQKPIEINEIQYHINMKAEGFILGVAWILVVGYLLDEKIYEHSYGNRLRKNLINKEDIEHPVPTYSPYLFEPYFQQYENWRDKALGLAKKALTREQDVIVLTLDFRRFFYSVDVKPDELTDVIKDILGVESDNSKIPHQELAKILTDFVGQVITKYSEKLKIDYPDIGDRHVLPIGFHPSNILANYCLKKFDEAIINGWNPIYYGRYVDDILIVDKVEKNSWVYNKAHNITNSLTADDLIQYFLLSDNAWERPNPQPAQGNNGLLRPLQINSDNEKEYTVNKNFAEFQGSDIVVQNKKVKLFYFSPETSDALLDCFQNKLRDNKSEFRFLPEDESIFQWDDYSEIYTLLETDGPNKLRGVNGIAIDKFDLSKFLGKYMRISGLIEDKKEKRFEKEITKIFDDKSIVDNYLVWEKVISILVTHENYEAILQFSKKIVKAVISVQVQSNDANCQVVKDSLIGVLRSALNRALSVVWGIKVKELIQKLEKELPDAECVSIIKHSINNMREAYCRTRMCDKYSLILPIDCFIKGRLKLSDSKQINLTRAIDVFKFDCSFPAYYNDPARNYVYYPYLVTVSELTYYSVVYHMQQQIDISDTKSVNDLIQLYVNINYRTSNRKNIEDVPIKCTNFNNNDLRHTVIKIGEKEYPELKVAVANATLYDRDFERVLKDNPNRSYNRYQSVVQVVNEALRNHANLLVMPESFLPFEWLPILARTCAKNQMAVVTGIEHIKIKQNDGNNGVYNLTATILPYQEETYKFSYIHFHSKTHFSPDEKDSIQSYRCIPQEANKGSYELYCWNDFWFPVYCCYELASIHDRALFQSYADAVVAVEWNKDTKYYSNIVESLARDLHCYCIQVNTAKYGDSRITQPAKSEEKDILKVKGGINSTVLIDTLDIKSLRDFQIKGNLLQAKQRSILKQTPPDFDYDIVQSKIDHNLWDILMNHMHNDG